MNFIRLDLYFVFIEIVLMYLRKNYNNLYISIFCPGLIVSSSLDFFNRVHGTTF